MDSSNPLGKGEALVNQDFTEGTALHFCRWTVTRMSCTCCWQIISARRPVLAWALLSLASLVTSMSRIEPFMYEEVNTYIFCMLLIVYLKVFGRWSSELPMWCDVVSVASSLGVIKLWVASGTRQTFWYIEPTSLLQIWVVEIESSFYIPESDWMW